jgi:hypothetical protein
VTNSNKARMFEDVRRRLLKAILIFTIADVRDEVLWDQRRDVVVVFGLDVFCQFEESENLKQCTVYTVHGGRGWVSNSGTLASNRQNTAGQNTMTTSLCWSYNTSYLSRRVKWGGSHLDLQGEKIMIKKYIKLKNMTVLSPATATALLNPPHRPPHPACTFLRMYTRVTFHVPYCHVNIVFALKSTVQAIPKPILLFS